MKLSLNTAETASLQAIIDQVETYKALKEAFTAQKAVEQAAQDKANAALADAVDKAKKANDEAQAAYDKVFKEVNDNIETVHESLVSYPLHRSSLTASDLLLSYQ